MTNIIDLIKRNTSYIWAILSWVLMIWVFWFLEYRVYGGNLDIGLIFLLVYPPLFILLLFILGDEINERYQQRSLRKKKIGAVISYTLLIACTVFILWYLVFENPYMERGYQYITVMIILSIAYLFPQAKAWLRSRHQKATAWALTILFVIFILTALLFCHIADPVTVREGQKLVAESGYQNVRYVDHITNVVVLNMAFDGSRAGLAKHEDAMDFYLYRGEKDGEIYGIAVSLIGRRIVGEAIAEDNNTLFYYFKDLS